MQPPEARQRLIAVAEGLACPLNDDQADKLLAYLDLLAKWNRVYNLTAIRDPEQMLTQHVADSLALVAPLHRHRESVSGAVSMLDVGSGGGLPGVVIAVMMPTMHVTCVDAVAKKASFVRQVATELKLGNLAAAHSRVELLDVPPVQVITSRAFASLSDFTHLTKRHLATGGVWVAMKGRYPDDEIAALPSTVTVFHVEQLHVPGLDAERCLVWMRP